MFVVTADQIRSRAGRDLVPTALAALRDADVGVVRPFERTAGDEIQGLLDDAIGVVRAVECLVRAGDWRIGVGVGSVELPLPRTTRAGRGAAYEAARTAVEAAHPLPWQLAVRLGSDDSRPRLLDTPQRHADFAETALLLLARLLRARTLPGWEVADLLAEGRTRAQVAAALGVSASAVSQRVRRAAWEEQRRGARLAAHHLSVADGTPPVEEVSGDHDDAGGAGRGDPALRRSGRVPRQPGHALGVRSGRPA